jgi:hypothetical protein
MAVPRVNQQKITEAVDTIRWTASGDDKAAAEEARRRARQVAPDCIAFLAHVVRVDGFSSSAQRVRAASTLLEVAELLASESKPTGLFGSEAEDFDSADGRTTG